MPCVPYQSVARIIVPEEGTADTARRGRERKSGTLERNESTADTARRSRKRKSAALIA